MPVHISKRWRAAASAGVLILVIAAFIYYLTSHPSVIRQLQHTNPWLLALLVAMYGVFTLTLVAIQSATLRIIGTKMPVKENLLLTGYSSLANFFGPLQSGPGVRLVYLKKRYDINLKQYVFATFCYYGFFAFFSGLFLTVNTLPWWGSLLILLLIAGLSAIVVRRQRQRSNLVKLPLEPLAWLGLATLSQVIVVGCIYFVELRSLNSSISFRQALTYTGAANFALFVSLTPGAIGFRESFLLFSRRLHHIASATVLSASLIDRAANIVFLGILFLITLSVHANDRFRVSADDAKHLQ